MKALLIDFDDSFTYNVLQELVSIGIDTQVIHWLDFDELPSVDLLVVGPGPGHPDDYQRIFPLLEEWLKKERPYFGVCLGHQIFWRLHGEEVLRSKEPLHGQSFLLALSAPWRKIFGIEGEVSVQRYNSLSVMEQVSSRYPEYENLIQGGEILATMGKRVLTYQFHPESVGTTYRPSFFRPLLSIMA